MARKIIKAILFILAAAVVAGGIMTYLRSQKKVSGPLQSQTPTQRIPQQSLPKTSEIKQLNVNSQGSGAQVQITGITEHNYSIERLEGSQNGFRILVPNSQIAQVAPVLDKPHPLINKIEVHPSSSNPNMAELVFHTQKDVNFLDTQRNDTLTIDFVKNSASGDENAEVSQKETNSKNIRSGLSNKSSKGRSESLLGSSAKNKSSSKSKNSFANKKNNAMAMHSSSKKSKKTPKLKPLVLDDSSDSTFDNSANAGSDAQNTQNDLNTNQATNLNDFGSPSTATESIPQQQDEAPTIDAGTTKKSAEEDDGFNLKDVVKEEPKAAAPAGNANLLDAETQMSLTENNGAKDQKVASIPNQKFDLNKIQANLPALQNMSVARSGNATVITFDREKAIPFKVFRMVNPSRVVVDFKDAKSKLKPDYPRFTGTKISRVETREYAGVDGMLVRVIMYVDGAPNFTSNKNGNQLVIELQ